MATPAQYLGTGKRKTSVARVILRPGGGDTWINGKKIEEYFPRQVHRMLATAPLKTAGLEGQYDLRVRVPRGSSSRRHSLAASCRRAATASSAVFCRPRPSRCSRSTSVS